MVMETAWKRRPEAGLALTPHHSRTWDVSRQILSSTIDFSFADDVCVDDDLLRRRPELNSVSSSCVVMMV
jgi:hypothetical protein